MKIDRLEPINHFQQSALASPGSGFCPPSTTLVFMVALCNGFHNTTLNLRSRSPLAHFELIYIYNPQRRLHIPKGDLDQYVQILYQTIAHLDSSSMCLCTLHVAWGGCTRACMIMVECTPTASCIIAWLALLLPGPAIAAC